MNFLPTNDFSLLEICQVYTIEKYKANNPCKIEAVIQRCSVKKVFLNILPEACNFNKKETLAQVFSYVDIAKIVFLCEYCETFKNTFFIEHLRWLLLVKLDPSLWNQQNFNSSYF